MSRWTILFRAVTLAVVMGGLVACNTIQGMGKDLERAGEVIQEQSSGKKD